MRQSSASVCVAVLIGASLVASVVTAQDPPVSVAVLAFHDGGSHGAEEATFGGWTQAIPAMLMAEIRIHPDVRLIGRSETQPLFDEHGTRDRLDAATAATIGRQVGARFLVYGTFVDLYGRFRMDARIVETASGEIMAMATALGQRHELFQLIQQVADQIAVEIELPPLSGPGVAARQARDIPTEALTYYGMALVFFDQGDTAGAIEYYRRALDVFPEYAEAREELQRIGG